MILLKRSLESTSSQSIYRLWKSQIPITESRRYRLTLTTPTLEVVHPNVRSPNLPRQRELTHVCRVKGKSFYPLGCSGAKHIESIRTGQFLGNDYPWNFISRPQRWRNRLYNVTHEKSPYMVSDHKGVSWYQRLNQWHVQWVENGVHRIRAFKAGYGIRKTKNAAEKYREDLEAAGRVDNRQTDRQARIAAEEQRIQEHLKRKMTFIRTKEELIQEWDRYWGAAQYHWDDNHLKLQRKKLGKVVDPKYRPPDIDIKKLRAMK